MEVCDPTNNLKAVLREQHAGLPMHPNAVVLLW